MVLLCANFLGSLQKMWGYPKIKKFISSIVLTVIHIFGAVIEQLSLAIEIMVTCSHAGPSNKRVKGS